MDAPSSPQHLLGALFALSAGACFAVASIFFSSLGKSGISSLAMNLAKGFVALLCLGFTHLLVGFTSTTAQGWLYLGASGVVGITVGDTAFFLTLKRLGPRRTLLMMTLSPVLVALASMLLLAERLTAQGWIGAALCVCGVTWTMWERLPLHERDQGSWRAGVGYGLLTVLCFAAAVILTKVGLRGTRAVDATFIRLLCGTAGLLIYGLGRGQVGSWLAPFRSLRLLIILTAAAVVGSYLGIWSSILALAYTSATVATILGSTEPIFVLPLAYFFLRERVSPRSVVGAVVAVAGVALLMAR